MTTRADILSDSTDVAGSAIAMLADIIDRFELHHLRTSLEACRHLNRSAAPLDVAVFGQFKSGKSSLLNALLGQDILPVGVLPVTALITRVSAGDCPSAEVTHLDGGRERIALGQIADFVEEARNPRNRRQAAIVDVNTPSLAGLAGLRLVDTPGLGSVFSHNTESTRSWLPNVAVALLAISVERPLSDEDKKLLTELRSHAPRVAVVLTKVDLFDDAQVKEVQDFMRRELSVTGSGDEVPVLLFSNRRETARWIGELRGRLLEPLRRTIDDERRSVLSHKSLSLIATCRDYLMIALRSAERADEDRERLRRAVLDESVREDLIRDELAVACRRLMEESRPTFRAKLLEHQGGLTSRLKRECESELQSWTGNLSAQTARFEKWIGKQLEEQLSELSGGAALTGRELGEGARERLGRIVRAYQDRLRRNVAAELDITLADITWQASSPDVLAPPVAISRVFDIQLDLLWFLFPMGLFGGLFQRHFLRRIPWEVEKNLTRLANDWAERVNLAIETLGSEATEFVAQELSALEKMLSQLESGAPEIREMLESLNALAAGAPVAVASGPSQ